MISSGLHWDLWRKAWENACNAVNPQRLKEDTWREPFQLLTGGLVYSGNALRELQDDQFHVAGRTPPSRLDALSSKLFDNRKIPYFHEDAEVGEFYGMMHLASVSVRLSTALFLVGKHFMAPFKEFVFAPDWARDRLKSHLENTKNLNCCHHPGFGQMKEEDVLCTCLAMILAHRDEFAHGETGEGSRWWYVNRQEHFEKLFRCRLAEAQLRLTSWGLSLLAK